MRNPKTILRVEYSFTRQALQLFGFLQFADGKAHVIRSEMKVLETEPGMATEPLMSFEMETGQQLMDDLWHAGLRPREAGDSAGKLSATERHLKDLQKLVDTALPLALRKD